MGTANNSKGFKSYIVEFREFHKNFYKQIRDFLVNDQSSRSRNSGNNKTLSERQVKYQSLLTEHIKEFCSNIISTFLYEYYSITRVFPKSLGATEKLPLRGLVYLHSREFGEGEKIKIPFGYWHSEMESTIEKQVFNRRHAVAHILGETMWRFFETQTEDKIIPCIYFSSDAHPILDKYKHPVRVPLQKIKITDAALMSIKTLEIGKIDWDKKLYAILIANNVFQEDDITTAKRIFQSWVPSKSENIMFLIEGTRTEYTDDDIRRLLANPIRQAIISDASNIFYITDIHRGAITGGLICELALNDRFSGKDISSGKLSDILNDLQWIFSNYVFSALSSCESEFGSGIGFTYSEKFYTGKNVFDGFKENLNAKIEDSTFTKELEPIKYFFESVSEERGQCVRGYDEIAKKAFVTACKLWNSLEVYNCGFGKIIEDDYLIDLENNVITGFEKIIGKKTKDNDLEADVDVLKNEQPALNLLWIALDFEGTLKNIPSYREHFLHSFHIFCLGLWIIFNKEFPYNKKLDIDFLRKWYLASFWHDVPYAMQKLDHISNVFIKRLITHGYKRKKEGLLVPISPNWGHLLLAKDFYKLLLGEDSFKNEVEITLTIQEDFSDVILERMLEKAEHGILSGLILYHQICNKNKNDNDNAKSRENLIPVIVAIMLHGCYEWHWKDGKDDKNGKDMFKINIEKAPIAHLLMLCDSLVQCGREFTDLDTKSETEIRFKEISDSPRVIKIQLEYSNASEMMCKIKEKYFDPVLAALDLNRDDDDIEHHPQIECVIKDSKKTDNMKRFQYPLGPIK